MSNIKDIRDFLHLYLGCECLVDQSEYNGPSHVWKLIGVSGNFYEVERGGNKQSFHNTPIKPLLRPLSDMKEEEMIEVIKILFSDAEEKIQDDELSLEMFYWDNATMVDGDIQVGADFSCRCFEGQIAIRECGTIMLFDEGGDPARISNVPAALNYMRRKGFDCDKLIPAGLAIDKTKKE